MSVHTAESAIITSNDSKAGNNKLNKLFMGNKYLFRMFVDFLFFLPEYFEEQ